jgi:hypothetical protein
MRRRVLDWTTWILFMFVFLAAPHSLIPYVQMGFISSLYKLIFDLSFEVLPIVLRRKESLWFSFSLVMWMCLAQLSFLSKYNPKYLTVSELGIISLFSDTGGGCCILRVNVVLIDLDSFIFVCHWKYQGESRSKCFWSDVETVVGSVWVE